MDYFFNTLFKILERSLRRKESDEFAEYYLFNAFNCMKAYSYSGERYGYYGYDASGERTYKIELDKVTVTTNEGEGAQAVSTCWEVDQMMLYPNGYMNMNQTGAYTKHYYADALRIASKIGSGFEESLCDAVSIINDDYPGYLDDRITIQYDEMKEELTELVVDGEEISDITPLEYPNLCDVTGGGNESELFFYHADHLGSTGMVTDNLSNITAGYLYAPFGEILQEHLAVDNRIPKYAFNAKELDEENNMYYYSARYYAPPTFISRDPMFEKYPSISPYTYCMNNPVGLIDPTGEDIELTFFGENTVKLLNQIINNGLGGQFEVYYTKGKNGGSLLKLKATKDGGDLSKMTDLQKAFYNELSGMINNHSVTARIDVVWGKKEICIGHYQKNTIDIADINQFDDLGKGLATKQGKLIHEFSEQFGKAKLGLWKGDIMGRDYQHQIAIIKENKVNGSERKDKSYSRGVYIQEFSNKNGKQTYEYNTKNGIIEVKRY